MRVDGRGDPIDASSIRNAPGTRFLGPTSPSVQPIPVPCLPGPSAPRSTIDVPIDSIFDASYAM